MNNLPMGTFENNHPISKPIFRKVLGGLGALGGFSGRLRSAHARRRIDYHFNSNSQPPKSSQKIKNHQSFNALLFGTIAGEWENGDQGGMIAIGGHGRPHALTGPSPSLYPCGPGRARDFASDVPLKPDLTIEQSPTIPNHRGRYAEH